MKKKINDSIQMFDENEVKIVDKNNITTKIPTLDDPALRVYKPKYLKSKSNQEKLFKENNILDFDTDLKNNKKLALENFKNKIICGDSVKVLKQIPNNSIKCIITSPPYWNIVDYGSKDQYGQSSYNKYLNQLLLVWNECARVLKPNGKLCINTPIMPISKVIINSQHTRHLKNLNNDIEASILNNIETLNRYSLFIWQKQTTEKMFGSYPFPPNLYEQNTVEFINILVKEGEPDKFEMGIKEPSRLTETEWLNLTKQIWKLYPQDVKRAKHPAPFPTSLANRLIAMYSFMKAEYLNIKFEGDYILDPFVGTGSTCIAAKELGRNYIGIDLISDFCIEASQRLSCSYFTGKIDLKEYGEGVKKRKKQPVQSNMDL